MRLFEMMKYLGVDTKNLKDFEVKALSSPQEATQSDLIYIDQDKYLNELSSCRAGAVLVNQKNASRIPDHIQAIIVQNPHLAFAYLSSFFVKEMFEEEGVEAKVASSSKIMNGVYLGRDVEIGEDCIIMSGVVIGDRVKIGNGCKLFPNVVLYADTVLKDRVSIHAGTVVGSDGFGYAHTQDGVHIKIHHNGCVIIEDDVEIGANCTLDRAVFGETRIKKGSKIDNLVQIGHNCIIGEHTILVSQVGLAGSTTTGRNVVMGGQAGSGGHIHIGDFTQVAGRGAVGKNLPPYTKWGGHPLMELDEWMRFYVTLRKMVKQQNS
ncbi:UDP-3-O-(3-hydroxymyristoyl)glucosamine N-acyltransferase [Helicobacter cholecystus]|uniref:UDP-3-O-acylglucosamine N-acyltransferase n=1 Tax=Helicobacter cholecystus TaxID=45498 RepID=A0A3D8IUT9_9HELI|nr:UDP-3-O-(3-hydroxymyristoyl)glucosamine N-acyltransferase [Helicobacter cholecystus]RDU69047.1 UDP-3-O-(3-hydroxymyristoyl)glucosamine N-acyltransferase [Helicobacter cholecystus]VEJ24577.1 UDP-3-O-[3-hydroxymyristoyl] glucosamine N-acyltransferase [Helicobacter cholecystus]